MEKRAGNVNSEQKEILLQFMKKKPHLNKGKFTKDYTFQDSQKLWEEVSGILNAVPTGGYKQWKQWRKVWQDMRSKAKSKKSALIKSRNRTGGGTADSVDSLDVVEESILELVSPVAVGGLPNVAESSIQLPLEVIVNCNEEHISELRNNKEMTDDGTETVNLDSLNNVHASNSAGKENDTVGRSSKVRRLENTLSTSKNLLNVAKQKITVKEQYYEKKLALLERDVMAKESIAAALNNIVAVLSPNKL